MDERCQIIDGISSYLLSPVPCAFYPQVRYVKLRNEHSLQRNGAKSRILPGQALTRNIPNPLDFTFVVKSWESFLDG